MSNNYNSNQVLQYAKARTKLCEFGVAKQEWPHFARNPEDLSYSSILAISQYCDLYLKNQNLSHGTAKLRMAASYYDSASNDTENSELTDGELILASVSYFLLENYGSCLVTVRKIRDVFFYGKRCARIVMLIRYLLGLSRAPSDDESWLFDYLSFASDKRPSLNRLFSYYDNFASPEDRFFGKVLCVVSNMSIDASARISLPAQSNLSLELWKGYLRSERAPRILWKAQQEIARSGVLGGKSIFIQLPTGSGKTKSIELILRSRILSGQCRKAVVIAPFLSLCTEIETTLHNGLSDIADIYKSTYALEIDTWISDVIVRPRVMVFTPEKYSYIARHDESAFQEVNIYIFDEAHIIADAERGPLYELTVTEILIFNPSVQVVMISAVLPNPKEFAAWAMHDKDALVSNDLIPCSEKAIGFTSSEGLRISYRNLPDIERESFFVPLAIKTQKLIKRSKREKDRYFPCLDNEAKAADRTRDKAIYLANLTAHNGGVAIFIPTVRSFPPFYNRLDELRKHACALDALEKSVNSNELQKMRNLFALHYGLNNSFDEGIQYGILPHYRRLAGCIRPSVEKAIIEGDAPCVACTATLSQGVNLPIKYLIITGTHTGTNNMSVNDFQNLVGRTARPGKYSEGSVLVLDTSAISTYYSRLKPDNSEQCRSAILSIFDDVSFIDENTKKQRTIQGTQLLDIICTNIDNPNIDRELFQRLVEAGCRQTDAYTIIGTRMASLKAVETYICQAMYSFNTDSFDVKDLCNKTLAFIQAEGDQEAKRRIVLLFETVFNQIQKPGNIQRVGAYSKTQMGVSETNALYDWCRSNKSKHFAINPFDEEGLQELCLAFQMITFRHSNWLNHDQLTSLVLLWLQSKSIQDIIMILNDKYSFEPRHKPTVNRIEKELSETISFDLSNFVSCITDLVEFDKNAELSVFSIETLRLLHRCLKYGVSTQFECLFCEHIIDDRLIANRVLHELDLAPKIDTALLKNIMRGSATKVNHILKDYPGYCIERFNIYLSSNPSW